MNQITMSSFPEVKVSTKTHPTVSRVCKFFTPQGIVAFDVTFYIRMWNVQGFCFKLTRLAGQNKVSTSLWMGVTYNIRETYRFSEISDLLFPTMNVTFCDSCKEKDSPKEYHKMHETMEPHQKAFNFWICNSFGNEHKILL